MKKIGSSPYPTCLNLIIKSLYSVFPGLTGYNENIPPGAAPATSRTRQNVRDNRLRTIVVILLSLPFLSLKDAKAAVCGWGNSIQVVQRNTPVTTKNLEVTLSDGYIGSVIGHAQIDITPPSGTSHVSCQNNTVDEGWSIDFTPAANMRPIPGMANVYRSGIEGIGLRFTSQPSNYLFPHIRAGGGQFTYVYHRTRFDVELIRTGNVVAGPSASAYLNMNAELKFDGWVAQRITGSVLLNVKEPPTYSSCTPVKPVIDVPLEEVSPSDIRDNSAPPHPFDLEIHCKIPNPNPEQLPSQPVRVYFQGDHNGDGLLKTQVKRGASSGLQISLEDSDSRKLPFNQNRAIPVSKDRINQEGVIYKLTVIARYVSNGKPIETGSADASLTYVIEFN